LTVVVKSEFDQVFAALTLARAAATSPAVKIKRGWEPGDGETSWAGGDCDHTAAVADTTVIAIAHKPVRRRVMALLLGVPIERGDGI
jgi:hypothetical protein